MDNTTSVDRDDTDSVDEILVPWVSSNDSYDPTIYRFMNGFQNLSIPSLGVEDDTADMPVMFSVRLAIMVGVISGIFILAWASLSLHRKRVKDSKKRKQRKETLL